MVDYEQDTRNAYRNKEKAKAYLEQYTRGTKWARFTMWRKRLLNVGALADIARSFGARGTVARLETLTWRAQARLFRKPFASDGVQIGNVEILEGTLLARLKMPSKCVGGWIC